ncbi:MBL fold metallo-hydrolase [Sedimenticola sp.]|uniref:MBL fold metallo-hydrolase n=1 Tax=Sedimenticola sp. TaxID=1940285 RepID=UPI003D0EC380
MKKIQYLLFSCTLLWFSGPLLADDLVLHKLADNIYAIVGERGNRTPENLGNNATFGVIVTADGVIVIDTGGTFRGAQRIHTLIKRITDKPVHIVINTGGQDHRWMGNGYFKSLGARVLASEQAVADQRARSRDQFIQLDALVGQAGTTGTEASYADETFRDKTTLALGGVAIEIVHTGPAHTPGDSFVWLPAQRILFAGDIVYTERMLGVGGQSNSKSWIKVFEAMAALKPEVVVPGHGQPTTLERATKDTYDYLVFLRQSVKAFMEQGGDMTTLGKIDQSAFRYLMNFDTLAGRNAQQVYSELEWE